VAKENATLTEVTPKVLKYPCNRGSPSTRSSTSTRRRSGARCDVGKGKRRNRETLEVTRKGKSIADVLDMTVEEAAEFSRRCRGCARAQDLEAR
jgi:hypothetical protein